MSLRRALSFHPQTNFLFPRCHFRQGTGRSSCGYTVNMGAAVADRTLFVGNLHPKATEELLFELFLQAGPAVNVKIPKDKDGKPKLFAFVNFKHEESVPYGMNLLNGIKLFGRPLNIQYRSGSSHGSQDTISAAPSPQGINATAGNGQASNGSRQDYNEDLVKYSDLPPVPGYQRSYSSPENLQRQAMMNNFYKQESPHGSRAPPMGQQPSPPSSSYTPTNSWYSPSSNPTPRRYDSPPESRNSRNIASHPYKNEQYYNRDLYSRVGQEEHHHRGHAQEEHHHRGHAQEEHHHRGHAQEEHHHRGHAQEEHHHRGHAQEEHHHRGHAQEEHHHRGHAQEEHHYRSRGQERLSPNPRKDPRWGSPHH